jgi:hypothetical protein
MLRQLQAPCLLFTHPQDSLGDNMVAVKAIAPHVTKVLVLACDAGHGKSQTTLDSRNQRAGEGCGIPIGVIPLVSPNHSLVHAALDPVVFTCMRLPQQSNDVVQHDVVQHPALEVVLADKQASLCECDQSCELCISWFLVLQSAVQRAQKWLAGDGSALEQLHDIFASYLNLSSLRSAMCSAHPEEHLPPPVDHASAATCRDHHRQGNKPNHNSLSKQDVAVAGYAYRKQHANHGINHTDLRPSCDVNRIVPVNGDAKVHSHGRVKVAVANDVGEAPLELAGNLAVLERLGYVSC